jgi:hypothetical protein
MGSLTHTEVFQAGAAAHSGINRTRSRITDGRYLQDLSPPLTFTLGLPPRFRGIEGAWN